MADMVNMEDMTNAAETAAAEEAEEKAAREKNFGIAARRRRPQR